MSDIVKRLRNPSGIGEPMDHMAMAKAATRIAELEKALRRIESGAPGQGGEPWDDFERCRQIARKALEPTP